ncbi:hypothetical protein [Chryseobacterium sp.]|uniref:hypothetical protein n=1 Tax=Chryseobacterium sp. TaxID=1871047 RepID=UPI002FC8CD33
MSLNSEKQTAINELKNLMTDMRTKDEISDEEFAEKFFELLLKWLKKADIKYTTGLVAGANPVTGTFTGKLE